MERLWDISANFAIIENNRGFFKNGRNGYLRTFPEFASIFITIPVRLPFLKPKYYQV